MAYKNRLYLFLVVLFLILGGVTLSNFIIDPYQIYHKHSHGFDTNQRYQNIGLINSYLNTNDGFDSIIIGTSLAENFVPSEVETLMNWGKVLNLTASGSSLFVQKKTIDKALKTGRVKHVIWVLNSKSLEGEADVLHPSDSGFGKLLYLYDNNPVNDIKYLWNYDVLKRSMLMYKGWEFPKKDLNKVYFWDDRTNKDNLAAFENFSSESNIKTIERIISSQLANDLPYVYSCDKKFPSFNAIIKDTVVNNPDVDFSFFFPPSTYFALILEYPSRFAIIDLILKMREKDVYFYGFDNEGFIKNLFYYKDAVHYSAKVSSYLIYKMGENENIVTFNNIEKYKESVIDNLNSYKKLYSEDINLSDN